jgi:hypothetical protein
VRRHAPLLGLTLAAAALRFTGLGAQSFWLDEAATGRLMRLGLWPMLRGVANGESTPPLYYVLAWLWTRATGVSETGLRSLSALLGTLTVLAVYAAAGRLLDRRAALAAAALATFSPLLVWYSQEARSYALLGLLAALSLWALPDALEGRNLWRWSAIAALALLTHYFALFLILPEGVAIARRRRAAPLLLPLATAAALAPLALTQRAHGTAHFIAESSLARRIAQIPKQLLNGYDAPHAAALLALAIAAALVALICGWRAASAPERRLSGRLAALGLTALVLPLVLALAGADYLLTRNVLAAWMPLALAGAVLASRGGRPAYAALAAVCAAGLLACIGIARNPAYQRDDWRAIARATPRGAALVASPRSGRVALEYYLPHARALAPGVNAAVDTVVVAALRGSAEPRSLAGFAPPVVAHRDADEIVIYRAPAPVTLTTDQLAALALSSGSPDVLMSG